jgi:hypothetical protein
LSRKRQPRIGEDYEAVMREILESMKRLDEKISEFLAKGPQREYWRSYSEVKRSFLRTEEWRLRIRLYSTRIPELQKSYDALGKLGVTYENYDKIKSLLDEHNWKVNQVIESLRAITRLMDGEVDRIREIQAIARTREWGLPGRPSARRRFQTLVEMLSSLLRKLGYLRTAYKKLIEKLKSLILPIPPKPPPPPPPEKLYRVQAMFRIVATERRSSKTPETIAEVRVWYYTKAKTPDEAENQFTEDEMNSKIWEMIDTEYFNPKIPGMEPIFDSLFAAAHHEDGCKIEVERRTIRRETEEVDEDEKLYDVGLGAQDDTLYQSYTFYKPSGRPKDVFVYDQHYIDRLLRAEVAKRPKPVAAPTAGREARAETEEQRISRLESTISEQVRKSIFKVKEIPKEQDEAIRRLVREQRLEETLANTMQRIVQYQKRSLTMEELAFYVTHPDVARSNEEALRKSSRSSEKKSSSKQTKLM